MINEIMQKIISEMEPKVQEWLQEAYNCGYKIGSEDATRRAHELYLFGLATGYTDAQTDQGAVDIEEVNEDLHPELFDEAKTN